MSETTNELRPQLDGKQFYLLVKDIWAGKHHAHSGADVYHHIFYFAAKAKNYDEFRNKVYKSFRVSLLGDWEHKQGFLKILARVYWVVACKWFQPKQPAILIGYKHFYAGLIDQRLIHIPDNWHIIHKLSVIPETSDIRAEKAAWILQLAQEVANLG